MINYFEKCQHCKPPERHPGCQDHCPHYKEGRAKLDADKARTKKERMVHNYSRDKHINTLDGIAKYVKKRPKNNRPK